ncbi:MAG: ABC transporter ATP-binding protein [bacterium]
MNVIEIDNITKVFETRFKKRKVTALKNFTLNIPQGIIFGLLGPNGAGKTTLVKILLGIVFPTIGDAKVLSGDISNYKIKKRIGYLPENHQYPNYLTAEQTLKWFGRLSGMDDKLIAIKTDELLPIVKLTEWRKTKIKNYSKGMLQRLGLAQAMMNDPDLLFLDEPTDGVDPIGRKEIRDVLINLKNQGKTIFLNSHLLSEVEMISDRVAILNKGELLKEGTTEDLTTEKEVYEIHLDGDVADEKLPFNQQQIAFIKIAKNRYSAKLVDVRQLNELIDSFRKNEIMIRSIIPQKVSLEDMFIQLINKTENRTN